MKLRVWAENEDGEIAKYIDGDKKELTYITDSTPRCLQQAERDLDLGEFETLRYEIVEE